MTDYKTLSDSELTEALNFHRRQRNMSRGINEAAHMRQTQVVRLLEAEEARRLEEARTEHPVKTEYKALMKHPIEHIKGLYKAGHKVSDTSGVSKSNLVTDYLRSKHGDAKVNQAFGLKEELEEAVKVDKKNYSWGKMITVRHGSSHSFPLHPEHQEKIKNLKDGESTAFRDETGSHVTAHREGDKVHLKLRGANQKTTVAHSHFTEEVNQLDEIGDTAKGRKALKAVISRAPEKAANLRMKADILGRRQFDPDVSHENSEKYGKASDTAYKKYQHTVKSAARAVDRLTKEEIELDEVSASTLRNYIDKSRADKKAAMKDRTAAEKNVKTYGMASDKKERDDAARRVGNRNQGISVANKKLGTYPADKAKAKVMAREEVEQIDEISTELKKRYVEKGAEDVVDRFTGRGKYEKPRNPAHFTKTGRVKKSALNRPEAIKYREKLDNRRDIVNKVSQEVHGKKRFGEEVEIDEAASYRDRGYANMLKADRKAEKELAKLRAQQAKDAAKKASKPEEFKEESNLRITKVYNKWPKPATYAVHNADRSYHKEFDSMEAAQAHKAEKSK